MNTRRTALAPAILTASITIAGITLAACSQTAAAPETTTAASTADNADANADANPEQDSPAEVSGPEARLVATYDGGITVLNAETLEEIADIPLNGFNRLNPLGDGRTVAVSTPEGFQVLDVAAWTEPHGDHTHSYTAQPRLTDDIYKGDKPGHVVNHAGRTLLFSDGDGTIQELDNDKLTDAAQDGKFAQPDSVVELSPHHGVAVALSDGGMVHTEGTEDSRSSLVAVDADGQETARINDCPGVHGEAAAADETLTFGCEDGVVIYKDGEFKKVAAADEYGRMGNQAGSEQSPIVLADYKVDPDAELERPTQIALINTHQDSIQLVDLGTSYSFRSLARGPEGEALVLGTDGQLRSIDPTTGEILYSVQVTEKWEEPEQWQSPRPSIFAQGDKAFITEPGAQKLHVVDIASGEVMESKTIGKSLNELTGITG
ncbi:zinc metallochaperone AztD [Corynebacterium ammoniagenes]|uniref:Secreted protein n=2 Tax=Corynebacterium ammoniagenes TaxID=1697 RepID=A0AAV5G6M9_CORAM|nr:zinc metallochaperone AztD [Corynebacterium ammoniagenes]AQS74095.1 hypothetical protein CA40472_09415 [Corynebacterium ammoniagenes]EFG81999.1 hypothetical protein HMPREF0281_00706 [Corynebacterium ammoniagenes DSM 20306]NMF31303.1 PQQ-binding-like beta-propeller repeat protein [Corynebacterium ammoniagenes]GJN42666.1 hypothetical protein CAT723_11450 [Corynebacterium ammoniagenes]